MKKSFWVPGAMIQKAHTVGCADCHRREEVDEAEYGAAIRAIRLQGWRLSQRGWVCPDCQRAQAR